MEMMPCAKELGLSAALYMAAVEDASDRAKKGRGRERESGGGEGKLYGAELDVVVRMTSSARRTTLRLHIAPFVPALEEKYHGAHLSKLPLPCCSPLFKIHQLRKCEVDLNFKARVSRGDANARLKQKRVAD